MKKGSYKCKRCGGWIIPPWQNGYYVQKVKVRNWKPAKNSFWINSEKYFKRVLVCSECYDEIKKAEGIFIYEIPSKYLMKRK